MSSSGEPRATQKKGRHQVPGGKGIESRIQQALSQLPAVSWGRLSINLVLSNDLCYLTWFFQGNLTRLCVLSSSHARQHGLGPQMGGKKAALHMIYRSEASKKIKPLAQGCGSQAPCLLWFCSAFQLSGPPWPLSFGAGASLASFPS